MRRTCLLSLTLVAILACHAARPQTGAALAPDPWVGRADSKELEHRAQGLLETYSDRGPLFTHDGRRLVFSSSRSGASQIYVADVREPASKPRRLFEWPNPVSAAAVTWDDAAVIFAADENGDEQTRFFKADLLTGQVTPLTPEPLNRDVPIIPERAKDRLFFSGRAISDAKTGIYVVPVGTAGAARRLYEDSGAGQLADVSRDGALGLFVRFRTHQEQELLVVNLQSGTSRPIYPTRGKAAVAQAVFSPDGRRIYVATDAGGEGAVILALDAEGGSELARYTEESPRTAAPESVAVSRQDDTVVATFDAGDHSVVRLLDAKTLQRRAAVQLPPGVGELGGLSDDGQSVALCWETVEHPCALYAVSTRTGAASPLRAELQPQLNSLPPVEVALEAVPSFDGLRIPTNVYRPTQSGKLPVILFLHGGPAGSSKASWSATTRFYLAQGYAWVSPNIRGSGGFGRTFEAADDGPKRPDSFRDIEAIRAWVSAQPWADPNRLVVMGGSFGGYLVLKEITEAPKRWRAAVDEFGIADFNTFMATTKGLVRENYLHELGDPERDAELLRALSPLNAVDKIQTPLFVYAGAQDPRVPRSQSDLIVGALRQRRVQVEYMVAENEGHGVDRRENQVELNTRVARFIAQALR